MEKRRDTFIFYRSFYEALKELPDASRLVLYDAIADYSLNLIEPDLQGIERAVYTLIRPILEANRIRYENGSKPKKKQTGSETEAKVKRTGSESRSNKDKDGSKDGSVYKEKEKEECFFPVQKKR